MSKSATARRIAVLLPLLAAGAATAQTPTICPSVTQQAVIVHPGTATPVRLAVHNAQRSNVTIYAYPTGGQLVWAGPSQLDYIFLPDGSYAGTTYASYRVDQPAGCAGPSLQGNVQFVIEGAPQVDVGGSVGVRPVICGADFIPVVIPPLLAFAGLRRLRRRALRSAA
ncbi:MAG: hypothetical protein U1A27_05250 [Phycisphaerae bacterium]